MAAQNRGDVRIRRISETVACVAPTAHTGISERMCAPRAKLDSRPISIAVAINRNSPAIRRTPAHVGGMFSGCPRSELRSRLLAAVPPLPPRLGSSRPSPPSKSINYDAYCVMAVTGHRDWIKGMVLQLAGRGTLAVHARAHACRRL